MPSPIAHSISGYLLSQGLVQDRGLFKQAFFKSPLLGLYAVAISNAPDLDFLPKLIANVDFHRGPSHSLLQALGWSLCLSAIALSCRRSLFKPILILTFALYASHLVLDFFTAGGRGLPLLWPLNDLSFQSPIALFPAVHHSRGLLDSSHLIFIGFELLYSLGLVWGFNRWRQFSRTTVLGGSPRRR